MMNDTFNNFTFTQTGERFNLRKNSKFCDPKVKKDAESSSKADSNNEISLDDSQFLSQYFSSRESTSPKRNIKRTERKNNILQDVETERVLSNCKTDYTSNSVDSTKFLPCRNKDKRNIVTDGLNKVFNSKLNISKTISGDSSLHTHKKLINIIDLKQLSSWGLPEAVLEKYYARGLKSMFPWQVECLSNEDVLKNRKNLIYSAPTSAGKTLVAEILALKTIFEIKKKVIFILPFVSIVREKMYYFQDLLETSGIRVEGFMGSHNPPGGFHPVRLALCTIEKANSLINRLLEENQLSEIGTILVDELHLLGDPNRGYLLELLLTKLKYVSQKDDKLQIQIIGMSATLPNLHQIAKWLNAELFTTSFRPIPLHEQVHICGEIYDRNLKLIRKLTPLPNLAVDTDNILQLCLETIKESCSVLIFCPTKNWCENLAQQISTAFLKMGRCDSEWGKLLRSQLNTTLIMELLEQLKYCPVGLDEILRKTVSFGVAFHHAGLTMDERDIIEGAFRNGSLRVLVATSTLSSGVNLPARRVIIRTANFHGKPIDALTYRQMIGRAGRMGKDTLGESFLICQKNDYKTAKELMSADLRPIESCLEGHGKLKRAILEVIASGVASTPEDVDLFTKCTLLAIEGDGSEDLNNPIEEAVTFLNQNEFVKLQEQVDKTQILVATSLGKACLSSSMAPDEGLALFTELDRARQCFVLDTELHLIYLITPYSACHSWGSIDWMFFLDLWEKLPLTMKKVGELIGVQESYIVNATRGKVQTNTNKLYHKFLVHKRFFVALALQDLVNEKPLNWVCNKFTCNRGMLQSLQQSASSFAGMVTCFSRELGWNNVELLISQFQDRMQFGVSRDLLDLMHLPILNGKIARTLYNAGIETVIQLANSNVSTIESILHKVIPFETEKGREGESEFEYKQRNKYRNIWVTGKEGMTEREAAEMFVADARNYLKLEIGLAEAKWENSLGVCDSDLLGGRCLSNDKEVSRMTVQNQDFTNFQTSKKSEDVFDEIISPKKNLEKLHIDNSVSDDSSVFSKDLSISDSASVISEANSTKIEDADEVNENEINEEECLEDFFEKNESLGTVGTTFQTEEFKNQKNSLKSLESSSNAEYLSNFSSSFSGIDFSDLEQKVIEKSPFKMTGTNKVFDIPNQFFNKNEVSQLLSPSSVELSVSRSSSFTVPDKINISVQELQSDQSLFDESFRLELSGNDCESPKGVHFNKSNEKIENSSSIETASFLEKAFTGSFEITKHNESDCDIFAELPNINSSGEENNDNIQPGTPDEILNFVEPQKSANSRKRFGKNEKTEIPKKKLKFDISKREAINESYIINKSIVNYSNMEIVDVCKDLSLLNLFCREIKQQTCVSLSVACVKIMENQKTIGENVMKSDVEESPIHFSFEERKILGFCFAWKYNVGYFISLDNPNYHQQIMKMMKTIVENENLKVRLFDAKEQIKVLTNCCKINFKSKIDDPKIADWILDPEGKEKNFKAMVMKYCPEGIELSRLSGGCKGVGSIGLDLYSAVDPRTRSAVEAIMTWHLVDSLKNTLKQENPDYFKAYDVECDTILCLTNMELGGICVSKKLLQELVDNLKKQMTAIENKAFSLAGRHFNFVSSKDVAKVIGIFRGKKISTKKQILEKNEHPISDMIVKWRKINTTLTKMIYPLIRVTKNNRIRGCYITHTSTGRITMQEPNLQNIAKDFIIENPFTKQNVNISCRSAFQVLEDHQLLSADYCQLELRILAHFSKDDLLCTVMNKPGDVFKSIAAKWNRVEEDKVSDAMRQNTKSLCYGIIYGMGSKTLADQLDLQEEEEAIEFMETFKCTYPGVQKFIKDAIQKCRTLGYIETITGRRRYLPNINDCSLTKRGQAERQAVNSIVQGSAADIVKKAMVEVEKELQSIFYKTRSRPRIVLHLHDELIYEVPTKYIGKVAKIIKKNMENSMVLSVPLPVKIKTGKSWGFLCEYTL
ncbi:DNA polymerase theta isoform X1 [Leptinotarsa decemlineata]|uniref:DNA polymerase theta isoform X1 n=1 Tax=Leptinotarsa decemlineata TaxID=7539 RepID=UPI003D30A03E